jgi:FKBP-type peptidyl-prolyl cis-trans isomerase
MRSTLCFFLCAAFVVVSLPAGAEEAVALESRNQKISYAIGFEIAKNLKNQGIELDLEALTRAFHDAVTDAEPALDDKERAEIRMEFQKEMRAKADAEKAKQGEANLAAGTAFLEKNKTAEGVVVLPSGLQYKILKEGDGPKPTTSDRVKVHYRGTLIDGKVFDSSYDRGEPASFGVTQVIQGWQEALQLMPVGSKWMVYIPASLGYGERGAGRDIGPNAALIFEVELLEIVGE